MRGMQITTGTRTIPTASVELEHRDGQVVREAAVGDGPVDAIFKAIAAATGILPALRQYRVRSVTDGEDAQGEVTLDAEHDGRRVHGRAVSTDIIEASALAFVHVVNRIERVCTSSAAAAGGTASCARC